MSRPKRIDLPFCLYHVFSRTNSNDISFPDSRDMGKFFKYLGKYTRLFSYRIHAWCLMPNHFHLLMESSNQAAISEFMRRLLTAYTIYFNRRHVRHGHLFQGRFKSYVVDKAEYLLALSRYIHLNPSSWSKPREPQTYPGSSLRYYLQGGAPSFLYTDEILSWFKGDRKQYERYVMEGMNQETKPQIMMQRYIGNQPFVRRLCQRIKQMDKVGSRTSRGQRKREKFLKESEDKKANSLKNRVCDHFQVTPDLLTKGRRLRQDVGKARKVMILLLLEELPWSHKRIANYLGLKGKSIISYHLLRIKNDPAILQAVKTIKRQKT